MPRTTELIAEESAPVSSPLRRSSRIVAVSVPPAEASKPIKSRRSSVTQENNDEEKVEAKPVRGRRASSIAKEDPPQKSEPAKTRTRRSSATTEPKEEEAKRQPIGRRRRSSATEEVESEVTKQTKGKGAEEEPAKRPLRGRRGSIHEEKGQEEETNTRTTRSTKSVSRDVSLEPEEKKPATRGRRKSVEVQEAVPVVEKKTVRTRRSSTEKLDGEPEGKAAKSAPSKPRRRLSITENAVNLAPIEEQEGERKSLSPVANKSAEAIQLTPIKKKQESAKAELDLSIINEISFSEENDVAEDKTVPETPALVVEDSSDRPIEEVSANKAPEERITTPKKSPRFRQSKSPKEEISSEQTEENKLERKDASPTVRNFNTPRKSPRISGVQTEPTKPNFEAATVEKVDERTEGLAVERPSSPRKSPRLTRVPTDVDELKPAAGPVENSEDAAEIPTARKSPRIQAKAKSVSSDNNAKNMAQEESKEEDDSVFTSEFPIPTEAKVKGSTYISSGSDDSFQIHLSDTRLQSSQDEESVNDHLNTSKASDSSDKENSAINVDSHIQSKISKTPRKEIMKSLIEGKESNFEQSIVVARVSNVFRPKNVDYSFVEPMDVDKTSIELDITNIDKTSNEPKLLTGIPDESVDESFSLALDVTKIESPIESAKLPELEKSEDPEIVEEVEVKAAENPEKSLKKSSAVPEMVGEIEKLDDAALLDMAKYLPSAEPVKKRSESDVLDGSIAIVNNPPEMLKTVEDINATETLDASTTLEKPIEVSDDEAVIDEGLSTNSTRAAEVSVIFEEPGNTTQALESSKLAPDESYNVGVSKKVDMSQDYDFDLPSDDDNEEMETTNLLNTSKLNEPANESFSKDSEPLTKESDADKSFIINLDDSDETVETNEILDISSKDHTENTTEPGENTGKVEIGEDHATAQESNDEKQNESSHKICDQKSDESVLEEKREQCDQSHQKNDQEINPTIAEADSTKDVLEKSIATSVSEEETEKSTVAEEKSIPVKIPLVMSESDDKSSPLNLRFETSVDRNVDRDGDKIETHTSEDEENVTNQNESAATNDLEDMEKSFQDVINEDDSTIDDKKVATGEAGCVANSEENKEPSLLTDQSEIDITSHKDAPQQTNEMNVNEVTEKTSDNESMEDLMVSKKLKKRVKTRKLDESNLDIKSRKSSEKIEKGKVDDLDEEADNKSEETIPVKKNFDIYEFFKKSEESDIDPSSPEPKEKIRKSKQSENTIENEQEVTSPKKKKKPKTKQPELSEEVPKTTMTPKRVKAVKLTSSKLDEFISKKLEELQSRPETTKQGVKEPSESGDEELGEEESESEGYVFIDDMAEEGEEDTPSEGSNDIVDEGESIHTESERETEDDYDSDDSFICDNDEIKLLSGDEYDLEDMKHEKKKKSRIINVDDIESDVITIERKEKPVKPKKRSRIITVSSSSEEEVEESQNIEIEDDLVPSTSQLMSNQGSSKRKSSITLIENINVQDIKDAALSERIHNLVDNFCTTIPNQGDISMNLSLEYARKSSSGDSSAIKDGKQKSPKAVEAIGKSKRTSSSFEEETPTKKKRLSTSLENMNSVPKDRAQKRKLSQSLEEVETKKRKKKTKKSKKEKMESPLKEKRMSLSEGDLQTQTFSLMNQLITDVKTRPKRVIKPTTYKPDVGCHSWVIDNVGVMKPSTSIVSKKEIERFKKSKRHPKDFRNEMLYDSSRVKRVDSKILLKKKGAYL